MSSFIPEYVYEHNGSIFFVKHHKLLFADYPKRLYNRTISIKHANRAIEDFEKQIKLLKLYIQKRKGI